MKRGRMRTAAVLTGVLLSSLASIGGCKITIGGGGSTGNLNLYMPYVNQLAGTQYCGVASVLMWRYKDGYSTMDQNQLASMMGCSASTGCNLEAIRYGVNAFTFTHDAVIDDYGGVGDPDQLRAEFHARQLQSLSMGYPVIAIIDNVSHAVVPNKGRYSTATDGLKRWDYVNAHDPSDIANRYFPAGEWMDRVIWNIVGTSAMGGWQTSLSTHGNIYVLGVPGAPFCPDSSENGCV